MTTNRATHAPLAVHKCISGRCGLTEGECKFEYDDAHFQRLYNEHGAYTTKGYCFCHRYKKGTNCSWWDIYGHVKYHCPVYLACAATDWKTNLDGVV
jgi:hypothetical protein